MSQNAPPTLQGERLLLRRLTLRDMDTVYAYGSDPEATRLVDWPRHERRADAEAFINQTVQEWSQGTQFTWGMERREDQCLLGAISCTAISHRTSIGYVLAQRFWGQGFATEAARLLVEWLSSSGGVIRVWATCDVENAASARVLEKAGMQREGILRAWNRPPNLPGTPPRDAYVYALINPVVD
ncbi:MAG: GNAT family N-acetyltransferase [Pseudomonadota bacterium]